MNLNPVEMKKTSITCYEFNRSINPILISLLLLIMPVMSGNAMPPAKKLKLSGTWTLNDSKSEFGEYGRMWASQKLIIVHKRKALSLERFSTGQNGEEFNVNEYLEEKMISLLFFKIGFEYRLEIYDELEVMFSTIINSYNLN